MASALDEIVDELEGYCFGRELFPFAAEGLRDMVVRAQVNAVDRIWLRCHKRIQANTVGGYIYGKHIQAYALAEYVDTIACTSR